jgi:tRNA threonylcarbamoyladenosine biosynthesis protein TsaB
MSLILSLETSTDVCSVAVHCNSELVKEEIIQQPQAHASRLSPLIQDILSSNNIKMKELTAIAVSSGPGSYTGLRIGTSTAKGLCLALDIPLISVPTLDVLAYAGSLINNEHALLCPMIDARRMEVFCQVSDQTLKVLQSVEAKVIDETSFVELLDNNKMLFIGNGAEKCKGVITNQNAIFRSDIFPSASSLGALALLKDNEGQYEDLVNFAPFYLKEFVAKKAKPLL